MTMIFSRRRDDRVRDTDPVYLTKEGLENLKRHLAKLKASLPGLAEEAQRTAAFGDRSDNAEYREAKGALRSANSGVINTEDKLKRVVLIETDNISGVVQIGSTVILESGGVKKTFQIVGSIETNPGSGRISNKSPLGEAILGKRIGDKFFVETPGGKKEYKIIKIS